MIPGLLGTVGTSLCTVEDSSSEHRAAKKVAKKAASVRKAEKRKQRKLKKQRVKAAKKSRRRANLKAMKMKAAKETYSGTIWNCIGLLGSIRIIISYYRPTVTWWWSIQPLLLC